MSLLLIGDSNVERIWLSVRNNREHLRSATFVPVKRLDQVPSCFQAITPSVSQFTQPFPKFDSILTNLTGFVFQLSTFYDFILIFVFCALSDSVRRDVFSHQLSR